MTAGQQAMAFGGGTQFSINVANNPGNTAVWGFGAGYGSVVPSVNYRTTTIIRADSWPTSHDFQLILGSNLPQNFFASLTVQGSNGVFRTFTSASAGVYVPGTHTTWAWGVGASVVFSSGPTPRVLVLVP